MGLTKVRFLLTLLLFSAAAHATANDRVASEEYFLNVVFFSDNKGLHTYPGLYEQLGEKNFPLKILERIGFVFRDSRPIGLRTKTVRGQIDERSEQRSFGVVSCAYCHTGKAAGRVIPGLPNKGIDLRALAFWGIGLDLKLEDATQTHAPPINALIANSRRMFDVLKKPAYSSPTVGLVENNVLKKTFLQAFGLTYDEQVHSFLNKPGHLWGIAEKQKLGLFWGAEGSGKSIGWAVAPEIMNGQTAKNIRTADYRQKVTELEQHLAHLQPPDYPYDIDQKLALGTGKKVFDANCGGCHGEYRSNKNGTAEYQTPKLIPQTVVQTDPNRSEFFDTKLWSAIERSEYADLLEPSGAQDINVPAYVAPRLEGVWARFPYLHNASVPTLMDLLSKAVSRPVGFTLRDAGEEHSFDRTRVGLKVELSAAAIARAMSEAWIYDVSKPGHSNQGHEFGTELAEDEKLALIEYLKTL